MLNGSIDGSNNTGTLSYVWKADGTEVSTVTSYIVTVTDLGVNSSDITIPVIITQPSPDKPNSPTQGEIKVPGIVDNKGNIIVNISEKILTHAFDKALADAKKNGNEKNGITVVLRVDTGRKTGSNVTVNLPKTIQDTIIAKKIVNTIVVVDSNGNVHWLVNSVYDSVEQVLRFSTNHFSTYGVGYKEDIPVFTDITNHWAKEDIEFVVSRENSFADSTKISPYAKDAVKQTARLINGKNGNLFDPQGIAT